MLCNYAVITITLRNFILHSTVTLTYPISAKGIGTRYPPIIEFSHNAKV